MEYLLLCISVQMQDHLRSKVMPIIQCQTEFIDYILCCSNSLNVGKRLLLHFSDLDINRFRLSIDFVNISWF